MGGHRCRRARLRSGGKSPAQMHRRRGRPAPSSMRRLGAWAGGRRCLAARDADSPRRRRRLASRGRALLPVSGGRARRSPRPPPRRPAIQVIIAGVAEAAHAEWDDAGADGIEVCCFHNRSVGRSSVPEQILLLDGTLDGSFGVEQSTRLWPLCDDFLQASSDITSQAVLTSID